MMSLSYDKVRYALSFITEYHWTYYFENLHCQIVSNKKEKTKSIYNWVRRWASFCLCALVPIKFDYLCRLFSKSEFNKVIIMLVVFLLWIHPSDDGIYCWSIIHINGTHFYSTYWYCYFYRLILITIDIDIVIDW